MLTYQPEVTVLVKYFVRWQLTLRSYIAVISDVEKEAGKGDWTPD